MWITRRGEGSDGFRLGSSESSCDPENPSCSKEGCSSTAERSNRALSLVFSHPAPAKGSRRANEPAWMRRNSLDSVPISLVAVQL